MDLIIGFLITLVSILVGFQLGRNQAVVSNDTKKQIQQIFTRVVPRDKEIGAVQRPTAQQNFYRDNPQALEEQQVMDKTFEGLNK